ncbi:Transformation/transcription domain-associated protein [Halotydeus destructor]|nr:Transformation/transcription domain-associated protein [Halotydeus destructor]
MTDPIQQITVYKNYVSVLVDATSKDETKLRAVQDLSENLETIVVSPQYPAFLEHAINVFLRVLSEGEAQFIAEHSGQQLRKLILEIIHRLPVNEHLKVHVRNILSLMFKLLEVENEENVLICLRIVIELHKQYRPAFSPEIQQFLHSVKKIYSELPGNLEKIFTPKTPIKVKDISEISVSTVLTEVFTQTPIITEKKTPEATTVVYNIIPKATNSLKVLAELPIIVVLMYQLYKANVHHEVADFIPLIMKTITLQPSQQHRDSPGFNREVYVDFMAAQIKTLSFLAYIVRLYQDQVTAQAPMLTTGMLGLLQCCPQEVAHLRKELLIAARHILATELRNKFVPCMDQLFDENVLIGKGWTAHESLRPLAYSTVADLVHHVRAQLSLKDLAAAVKVFSKNVHDESLPTSIQTMSCKLLLNLVECLRTKAETEAQARDLLIRMLEVFVLKFKSVAELQLPALQNKSASSANTPVHPQTSSANQSVDPKQQDDAKAAIAFPAASIGDGAKDDKQKFGFPAGPANNFTVADCKSLIKTLVCGVKTITWGIPSYKMPGMDQSLQTQNVKYFHPKEIIVFIRLVKYAMQALDIYTLTGAGNTGPAGGPQAAARQPAMQSVRSKEEKEVLEHFAGVFQTLSAQTFREIFSVMIDFVVERIHSNYALQIIANSFWPIRQHRPFLLPFW